MNSKLSHSDIYLNVKWKYIHKLFKKSIFIRGKSKLKNFPLEIRNFEFQPLELPRVETKSKNSISQLIYIIYEHLLSIGSMLLNHPRHFHILLLSRFLLFLFCHHILLKMKWGIVHWNVFVPFFIATVSCWIHFN